ncbi:MAG: hypothetical protein WA817_06045 [Candidatus Acidiferrum sp.]
MAALVLLAALASSVVRAAVRRFVVHFPASFPAQDHDSHSAMGERAHSSALPPHQVPQLQVEQKVAFRLALLAVAQSFRLSDALQLLEDESVWPPAALLKALQALPASRQAARLRALTQEQALAPSERQEQLPARLTPERLAVLERRVWQRAALQATRAAQHVRRSAPPVSQPRSALLPPVSPEPLASSSQP